MPALDAWRELHAQRFPELPFDCGRTNDPGMVYNEDLRDWSDKATTPDQLRIERYIDRYDLRQKRILHLGIGNSGLAQRLHRRTGEIVGTTVDDPEMDVARSLALPNYSFVLHNKYSGKNEDVPARFDFILDNNPTSPCCCIRHLAALFDFYTEKLADGGQIVTDRQGLGWIPEDSNPRWSFDFDDLAAIGAVSGFCAYRATRSVYALSRSAPPSPHLMPLLRHAGRRAMTLPGEIMRSGPRKVARVSRRALKWVLVSTVPWALPARYRPKKKL
jgi:hypothetical protein